MVRFRNKVALVTGGTAGIGYAIAAAFAAEGAQVIITGRNETQGREALQRLQAQGAQVRYYAGDASQEADQARWVERAVQELGSLNIAVNNAGVTGSPAPLAQVSAADFDAVFGINVRGLLLAMKHQFQAFQGAAGVIVNVSSSFGCVAMPGAAVYVASKHAVEGLTRAAALDGAKLRIRVNAVAPGVVETPQYRRFTGGESSIQSALAAMHPLGRIAQPEEIASAVLYLASDAASFTTGAVLAVDGGFTAQ